MSEPKETPKKGNGWGGPRPNSGRPKGSKKVDEAVLVEGEYTMLELLEAVALGRLTVSATQLRAAMCAVQYTNIKAGQGGKKEAASQAAEALDNFFPRAPAPRNLRVV